MNTVLKTRAFLSRLLKAGKKYGKWFEFNAVKLFSDFEEKKQSEL